MAAPAGGAPLLLPAYLAASALAATGMVSAITISAIAADRMLGSATWTGLPMAASILGTALGSHMVGRRLEGSPLGTVLASQYAVGLLGGLLALVAVATGQIVLLALGLATLGLGHGATQYMRYLAADLVRAERKPQALSWVVWTAGLGAVLGPSLLAPAGSIATRAGLQEVSGPYFLAVSAFALCAVGFMLAAPRQALARSLASDHSASPTATPGSTGASRPRWPTAAKLALFSMVIGHVTMVFVMTMTPIHLTHHGHGLGSVGIVISAHMAGMYLCAPVIGWAVSRWGSWSLMATGGILLAAAALLAALWSNSASSPSMAPPMALPLFLLGLGWNCGFVAGSAMLNGAFDDSYRLRGRGLADAAVWSAAATSSLTSSLLFSSIGFALLSWVAFVLSVGLVVVLVAFKRATAEQTTTTP